jgi:hypothetical protein
VRAGVARVEDGDGRSEGVLDCNSTVKVILSVFVIAGKKEGGTKNRKNNREEGPTKSKNISILIHLNIRLLVAAC